MVVARLQESLQTLRSELFPTRVLLELNDQVLTAQRLPKRREALQDAWIVPIPAATMRQGMPVEMEALGDFVGDLLLGHAVISAHLSVVLPAAATQWRVLSWPARERSSDPVQQLRQLVPDLGLEGEVDALYLDWMPLQGDDDLILLAAIQRSVLEAWLEVFGIAGVVVERVVPAQLALMAALQERLAAAAPTTLVALLMPEVKAVRLLVWRGGEPLYERRLAGTPEQWLPVLQASLTFLQSHRRSGPAGAVELLLERELQPEQAERFEELLGQPLELLDPNGYGSPVLQGLALLEGRT